jgi:AhpD family alkylhydroperoxidase
MKKFNLILAVFLVSITFAQAQEPISEADYKALLEKSPFNSVFPKNFTKAADAYFDASMQIYTNGPIKEKEAHLAALATSAATKCQYCIPYHIAQAERLGATADEVKAAIMIAADVMRMSTMFYGNEFDLEQFKAMLKN